MKSAFWAVLLLLVGVANAQQILVAENATPSATAFIATSSRQSFVASNQPTAPTPKFWGMENKIDFSIFAGQLAADSITTQRGLGNGFREANPLAAPFVNRGAPGAAAASALSLGAGIGVAYMLHRTHHYKAEHMAVRLMLAGEGTAVGRNIALLR
ncbi:MAG TPA: hypothetical protein VH079_00680 [Terriglobales bacterium]|jgi:hypothetical protein|nr:hypothetical protein [Terriglobales bacterium]